MPVGPLFYSEYIPLTYLIVYISSNVIGLFLGLEPVKSRAKRILSYVLTTAFIVLMGNPPSWLPIPQNFITLIIISMFNRMALTIYFGGFRLSYIYISNLMFAVENLFGIFTIKFREQETEINHIYVTVIGYSIEIVLLLFIWHLAGKKPKALAEAVRIIPKRIYICLLVIFYCVVFLNSIMGIMVVWKENLFIACFGLASALLIIPILIYICAKLMQMVVSDDRNARLNAILDHQLTEQINHYERVNEIYGEFRAFRHDMKNHLLCVQGYLSQQRYDEALDYMQELTDRSYRETNTFDTGNFIADALLGEKASAASESGTTISFSGVIPQKGIETADICTLFGNAVDNAVEACAKDTSGSEKTINVECVLDRGCFFAKITNPYFDDPKITGKNSVATSKEDKLSHGYGVSNIVRTAEKYGGSVDISAENGVFTLLAQMMISQPA